MGNENLNDSNGVWNFHNTPQFKVTVAKSNDFIYYLPVIDLVYHEPSSKQYKDQPQYSTWY